MLFLRKILNKYKQAAFDNSSKPFNLSKLSQQIAPTEDDYPIETNQIGNPSYNGQAVPNPVVLPQGQPQTQPQSKYLQSFEDYILGCKEEIVPIGQDAWIAFLTDPIEEQAFKSVLKNLKPDPSEADIFLSEFKIVNESRWGLNPQASAVEQYNIDNPEIEEEKDYTLEEQMGPSVFDAKILHDIRNLPTPVPQAAQRSLTKKNIDISEIIDEAREYAFGKPERSKKMKGQDNTDQRFNFFLEYPTLLPKNVQGGLIDFSGQNTFKNQDERRRSLIRFLKTNYREDLLKHLDDLILANHPNITDWLSRKVQGWGSKRNTFKGVGSIDVENAEGDSMNSNLSEKQLPQGQVAETDKVVEGTKIQYAKKVMSYFLSTYIGDVLSGVNNIKNDIVTTLLKKNDNVETYKAERLDYYIQSSLRQLNYLFKNESPKGMETKISITSGGSGIFKNDYGNVEVQRTVLDEAMGYVNERAVEENPDLKDSVAYDLIYSDSNLDKYMGEYLSSFKGKDKDGKEISWIPDFSQWVHESGLQKFVQNISELKSKIQQLKNGGITDVNTIMMNLNQDLQNTYGNNNDEKAALIKRTIQQDNDYLNKTNEQLLHSGETGEDIKDEEGNQVKSKGGKVKKERKAGNKELKGQFRTDVKTFMPIMLENKDKYPTASIRAFFSLVKPHNSILTGGKESGGVKNYTKMFYDLTQQSATDDVFKQKILKIRDKKIELDSAKQKIQSIKANNTLTPEQKDFEIKKLNLNADSINDQLKTIRPVFELAKRYLMDKDDLEKTNNKIDKLETALIGKETKLKKRKIKEPLADYYPKEKDQIALWQKELAFEKEEIQNKNLKIKQYEDSDMNINRFAKNKALRISLSSLEIQMDRVTKLLSLNSKLVKMASKNTIENIITQEFSNLQNKFLSIFDF